MKRLPSYYWDTSIFLSLLAEDDKSDGYVRACALRIIGLVRAKRVIVVTSVATISEVFPGTQGAVKYERFLEWLRMENLQPHSLDHPTAVRMAEARETLSRQKLSIAKRYWADTLHCVTAQLYEPQLDIVHSTDSDIRRIYQAIGGQLTVAAPCLSHIPRELLTPEERSRLAGQTSLFGEADEVGVT